MVARRVSAVVRAVVRAPATRWVTVLLVVLTGTLTVSVRMAMRAPDASVRQRDVRDERYVALEELAEVGFEADDASTQGLGSVLAFAYPTPVPNPTAPRPPRPPVIDDPVDPGPGDGGDGEEVLPPMVVTAVADRATAAQGEPIVYTFSVTNVSDVAQENIIAETHVPTGTYAAGSCAGFTNEGTLDAPVCADTAGLPASGSDDYHVLRPLGTMQPGATAQWKLMVRVGSDTPDGAVIGNHCRARTTGAVVVPSSDVWVAVT